MQLGLEEAGEGKGKGDERVEDGEDGEGVGDWNVVQNNGILPLPAFKKVTQAVDS